MKEKPTSEQVQLLFSEVYNALSHGRHRSVREKVRKLEDWLPDDPRAEKLRLWAALLEFDCGVKRSAQRCLPRLPPRSDQVELVYFHVELPRAPSEIHEAVDYLKVLQQSLEIARHQVPQARRILLTDQKTPVPASIGVDEVLRYDIDESFLMYERMRVQSRYLATRDQSRASILLDVDVIANRDPVEIFAANFDIGLTWRTDVPYSPLNGGMILVGPGERGLSFLTNALRCYDALVLDKQIASFFPQDLRAWWGDQMALAVMSGFGPFDESQLVAEAVISFFPASEYNCVLEPNGRYTKEYLASRYFIHFKGKRKPMLDQYVAYLQGSENRRTERAD